MNTLSGALVISVYHLIIFLMICDGFESQDQTQIAEIFKKMLKLIYPLFLKLSFSGCNKETLIILDV